MALRPRAMPTFQFQRLNPSFQSDPRRILGQALMGQGASTAPVRTPLQGLGRLSSSLVGAFLQREALEGQAQREAAATDALMGMLPENVSPQVRAAVQAAPGSFEPALMASMLQPTTTSEIVNEGDMAFVQTTTQPAIGPESTAITGLTQRRASAAPVSMYNPETREVQLVTPASAEQTQLEAQGFRLGNPPDAPSGFSFDDQGQLQIIAGSDQAFARGEKLTKTPREEEKKFELASTAFREAADLAQDSSGASDAGLIYKFFSALDPGGRVTDQEAMLAQTSASLGQQFAQRLRQGLKSGLLAPETRQEIVNTMRGLVVKRQDSLQKLLPILDERLGPLGFTSRDYFPFYTKIMAPLPTSGAAAPTQNTDIVPGQAIVTPGASSADPAIANATDADVIGAIF